MPPDRHTQLLDNSLRRFFSSFFLFFFAGVVFSEYFCAIVAVSSLYGKYVKRFIRPGVFTYVYVRIKSTYQREIEIPGSMAIDALSW